MRAVYRFTVCGLVGIAVALFAALVAVGFAVVYYGGVVQALDGGMPGVILVYAGAMMASLLAGFVGGLASLRLTHEAFRGVLLRIVLPGCLVSALSGAVGGAMSGTLYDPSIPRDESYIEVHMWVTVACGFIGPLIAWLANRALRGKRSGGVAH
jgi:hypothetical protein